MTARQSIEFQKLEFLEEWPAVINQAALTSLVTINMLDTKIIDSVNETASVLEDDYDDVDGAAALRATLAEIEKLQGEKENLQGRLQKLEFVERFVKDCGEHALKAALALARGRYAATHKYSKWGGEPNTIGGRHRKDGHVKDYLGIALGFFWTNKKAFLHWCDVIERENSKSLVYRVLKQHFEKIGVSPVESTPPVKLDAREIVQGGEG